MKSISLVVFAGLVIIVGFFFIHGSVIIKKVPLTDQEEACLNELLPVAFDGKGQGKGFVYVTSKEDNKIYLKLYAFGEFDSNWIAECPGGIGRAELMN
ncbi:hypothetical protein KW800_00120 [Candidatus Parcubacteria bacterium]|nr:hypothetical protein [Candidatus Parcubacteria bacterium]